MGASSEHFILRHTRSAEPAKFVISLSKKHFKKAVTRNAIRRRLRPLLRPYAKSLSAGIYMIVGKAGAEVVAGAALQKELSTLLNSYERA